MSYINIKVIAYSGHRDSERPMTLLINDEKITVVEIMDRWIGEGFADRERKRFFVIKADNKQHYTIYVDEKTSKWFCEVE
jgi:hypothetical protein